MVLWILATGLLLFIIFPVITRARLEKLVRERIDQEVDVRVGWSGIKAGWIRGFPDVSLRLFDLSVLGAGSFQGDTIAQMKEADLRINPFGIFSRQVKVHSVLLEHPVIRGRIDKDTTRNWDIFGEKKGKLTLSGDPNPAETEGKQRITDVSLASSLRRITINNGQLSFYDQLEDMEVSVARFDLDWKGEIPNGRTVFKLDIGAQGLDTRQKGVRYLRNGTLSLEMDADADLVNRQITLLTSELEVNGLAIEAAGTVSMPREGGVDLDLQFSSRETSLETLVALLPASFATEADSIRTAGDFKIAGTILGEFRDSIVPDVSLSLEVTDGYLAFAEMPEEASEIQISLQADYRGTQADSSWFDLEKLHVRLGEHFLDARCRVSTPVSDPNLEGMARGTIDFPVLAAWLPLDQKELKGSMDMDLRWKLRVSALESEQYEKVQLDGTLTVTDLDMMWPGLSDRLVVPRMNISVDPEKTDLTALDAYIGATDLHATGFVTRLVPWIFKRHNLGGSLNIRSGFLDIPSLIPDDTANQILSENVVSGERSSAIPSSDSNPLIAPPDSMAVPIRFSIPEKINLDLALAADQIRLPRVRAANLKGDVTFTEGQALVKKLSMEILEGEVTLSGTADTRGDFMAVEASVQVAEVDITSAYRGLVSVKQLAPMAGYCSGRASIDMQYRSEVDNHFVPLYGTMNVSGLIRTSELEIRNVDFTQVKSLVTNEKMQRMAPGEVEIGFYIRQGRIGIDPLTLDFDDSSVTVSGSHGIDHSLDYLVDMQIAKKDLGETARTMVNSLSFLAAATGKRVAQSDHVNVKAGITGTFEKPRVKTDFSGNLVSKNESGGKQ